MNGREVQCRHCRSAVPAQAAYCPNCGERAPARVPWTQTMSFRLLLGGYILFLLVAQTMESTGNAHLIPEVLMLGSAYVPIAFAYYLYEAGALTDLPIVTLIAVFTLAGVLGTVGASILENSLPSLILVGFIEEGCKAAVLCIWLRDRRLAGERTGLVLGAAAGMGFAAMETMGYGLTALLNPVHGIHGVFTISVAAMLHSLKERSLLAPLGHGTWTAILASAMWREQTAGRSPFGLPVLGSYVLVSILHSLYDLTLGSPLLARFSLPLPYVDMPVATLVIGCIGLLILRGIVRRVSAPQPVEPAASGR